MSDCKNCPKKKCISLFSHNTNTSSVEKRFALTKASKTHHHSFFFSFSQHKEEEEEEEQQEVVFAGQKNAGVMCCDFVGVRVVVVVVVHWFVKVDFDDDQQKEGMGVPNRPATAQTYARKTSSSKPRRVRPKKRRRRRTPNNPNQMLIYVPPHPLLKHWLAVARNASPSALFRFAMAEIGKILMYELSEIAGDVRGASPAFGGGERGSGGPVESDIDRSCAESGVNAGR